MIVVSDTSAITNLLQIGHLEILSSLFGEVIIAQHVYNELGRIPGHLDTLLKSKWLKVHQVQNHEMVDFLTVS